MTWRRWVLVGVGGFVGLIVLIGALTPQHVVPAEAQEHYDNAVTYRADGQSGLALVELEQALAVDPQFRVAQKARDEIKGAADKAEKDANAAATREARNPPTPGTEQRQASQWDDFTRYGQDLAKLLNQSDEINRAHARAAAAVTPATLVAFYQATDRAALGHANLKIASNGVRVPGEARDFKTSVTTALRQREDAMNKLKDALNKRSLSAQAAYADTKGDVDRSSVAVALQLLKLCEGIGAQFDECTTALGWKG